MNTDDLINSAQNAVLLMRSCADRKNNTDINVDFTSAAIIQVALRYAAQAETLITALENLEGNDRSLTRELLRDLKDAFTDFADFMAVYANKTGYDTKEQIAANIKKFSDANPVQLILGDW